MNERLPDIIIEKDKKSTAEEKVETALGAGCIISIAIMWISFVALVLCVVGYAIVGLVRFMR